MPDSGLKRVHVGRELRSAALPLRLALLREGRRPLLRVLRREDRSGDLALALPELLLGPRVALDHHLLRRRERERPVLRDRACELERGLERAAVVGEPVHEPELVAAFGGDRVAGQGELHRRALRDPPRQPQQRAAGGDQRPLHLGDPELRGTAGHDQVARERDLEPARDREPLDGGYQRLPRRALRDAREAAVADVRRLAIHVRLQAHAGAEASARAGEHADAETVVGVELVEPGGDPLGQGPVDGVAGVRAVERDDLDAAVALDENGRGLLGIGSHAPNANVRSMISTETTTLETRLPLVRLNMDGTRSVTALVAFDAGARTERPEENGMAHFLEHLVFKGGEKYASYRDVNETAERLGAQLNAYTSHDVLAFHITARAEALMPAVDLLTDFVARARIDADELDRERGVVIQEIHRSDDVPSSVADKLLDKAAYGDHPLGRSVLGPAEHISTFSRDAIVAFRERQWEPSRGGAFIAGDVSHADDDALAEMFARFPSRSDPPAPDPAPGWNRRIEVERRDTNQSHLRLHWRPSIDPADIKQRASLAVYATLLGGSMGSRLFDEIREQRGLCYAIRSYGSTHSDAAALDVSSGLDSTKCIEAYTRIREIVEDLASNGPRDGEVDRARAYAAGSTVLALESTGAVARRAAGQKVTFGDISSPDETIEALDAVTEDDVREVARGVTGDPVIACVGPHSEDDFP